MPGFLGGATIENFATAWGFQQAVPCHNTVETQDGERARWSPSWRWCAGYLIARNNVDEALSTDAAEAARAQVETSSDVVEGILGFVAHHSIED